MLFYGSYSLNIKAGAIVKSFRWLNGPFYANLLSLRLRVGQHNSASSVSHLVMWTRSLRESSPHPGLFRLTEGAGWQMNSAELWMPLSHHTATLHLDGAGSWPRRVFFITIYYGGHSSLLFDSLAVVSMRRDGCNGSEASSYRKLGPKRRPWYFEQPGGKTTISKHLPLSK